MGACCCRREEGWRARGRRFLDYVWTTQRLKKNDNRHNAKEGSLVIAKRFLASLIFHPQYPIPPRTRKKMTLVLDLDETLIHTTTSLRNDGMAYPDLHLEMAVKNGYLPLYVFIRPYLHTFLREVGKWYEVVLFTASERRYAETVVSRIDTSGVITRMFFRDSCTVEGPSHRPFYVKDLTIVRSDLSKVVIVDNSPIAYRMQPENALPCSTWDGDPSDTELLSLLPILSALQASTSDVRSVLSLRLTDSAGEDLDRHGHVPDQYQVHNFGSRYQ